MIKQSRASGFTLIEVLIAGVITSIMVLGLSTLWTVSAQQFLELTLRQKAIFVLDGNMSRLAAFYEWDADGYLGIPTKIGTANIGIIYGDNGAVEPFVTEVVADFETDQWAVFYNDQAATGSIADNDENYVWIDQDRNIVGKLFWVEEPPPGPADVGHPFYNCSGAGLRSCREITLNIEFPYRWLGDGTVDTIDSFRTQTIDLKTIVGLRIEGP